MGRLIDANALRSELESWGMNDYEPSDFTDAIDDAPTIEVISKADYENRLKADMVAMLTEIQLEIEELDTPNNNDAYMTCSDIIQQKIDALKVESENNK